jgi:formylglycine-generating enzyme required for sulfatase activity
MLSEVLRSAPRADFFPDRRRHEITQTQWRAVAELPQVERELNPNPGSYKAEGLWESHAQPGYLPVNNVRWHDCQEWLIRVNHWLLSHWQELGKMGEAPQLTLPSESQWEVACRAGADTPFHFGDTLDTTWTNFNGGDTYGRGRKGAYRQRPVPISFSGLVNRWGLAEMHGELFEWCGDQWHPHPTDQGWSMTGLPWEGVDPALEALGTAQREWRVLRGGSWFHGPDKCRAGTRGSAHPAHVSTRNGLRPCCLLPPGSLLGS